MLEGGGKIRRTKYVKNFLCEGVGGEKNAKTLKKDVKREGGGEGIIKVEGKPKARN